MKAKIYKIVNTKNKKIYVGSTTLSLKSRFKHHKRNYYTYKSGKCNYCRELYQAMDDLGFSCFSIVLIRDVEVKNIKELFKIESQFIMDLNAIDNGYNITLPYGMWHKDSPFHHLYKERQLEYRKRTRKHKRQVDKIYREKNKEKIAKHRAQKITCECGMEVTRPNLPRHKRCKQHIEWTKGNKKKVKRLYKCLPCDYSTECSNHFKRHCKSINHKKNKDLFCSILTTKDKMIDIVRLRKMKCKYNCMICGVSNERYDKLLIHYQCRKHKTNKIKFFNKINN